MRKTVLLFLFCVALIQAKGVDKVYCEDSTLVSDFFSLIGISPKEKGYNKSYALVVGISEYRDSLAYANLPTQNDPIDMAEYLCKQAGFDHVHLLTEERVTVARVRELMEDYYPKRLNSNDRFLFYWSGHGEDEKLGNIYSGHLPVYHSQSQKYSTMIKMSDVKGWDKRLQTKTMQTLYLIDSCFSGLVGVVGQDARSKRLTLEQLAYPSYQILSAGSGNQKTFATEELGGSIFSRAILDGLTTGKADKSTQKDGVISVSELRLHIAEYVRVKKSDIGVNFTMKPQLRDLHTNQGEFYFFTKTKPKVKKRPSQKVQNAQQSVVTQSSKESPKQKVFDFSIPEMVRISKGSFMMGSENGYANEKPVHQVTIEDDFEIGKYEVTFEEYDYFCKETGRKKPDDEGWGRGKRPVINVSWYDATAYVRWLSQETGHTYRLPTEAEWEYVARAGTTTKWSFGNDESKLEKYAWYGYEKAEKKTHPVGEKKPNSWDVYDIHGNVWEWTSSCYTERYKQKCYESYKVLRGGSWYSGANDSRSACRDRFVPGYRGSSRGFRLLRTLP
jgi:formylglycine-generating enzyme required for sulfatase activity